MVKEEVKPVLGYQRSEQFYQAEPQFYQTDAQFYQTEPQFHQMRHPAYGQPCPGYSNYPPAQQPLHYYDCNYPARPLPYVSPDVSEGLSFVRVMLCLMMFLILFVTIMSVFTWWIFASFRPMFILESFDVRSFEISGGGGAPTLKANWETKVLVKNPNHRTLILVKHVESTLVYRYSALDTSSVECVEIEKQSTGQILDAFSFPNSKWSFSGESVVSDMAKDRERGKIMFDLKLDVQIVFKGKVMWKADKMLLFCEGITLNSQNGSSSIPTWNGPKQECLPGF